MLTTELCVAVGCSLHRVAVSQHAGTVWPSSPPGYVPRGTIHPCSQCPAGRLLKINKIGCRRSASQPWLAWNDPPHPSSPLRGLPTLGGYGGHPKGSHPWRWRALVESAAPTTGFPVLVDGGAVRDAPSWGVGTLGGSPSRLKEVVGGTVERSTLGGSQASCR